jgi:hypothetical protein
MATLTVTLTEDLTLNGYQQGSTNSFTIASITQVTKKIVSCTNDQDTTIIAFDSDLHDANSVLDLESTKYIRITNLDASNTVNLSLQIDTGSDGADHQTTLQVAAGQSFVLGSPDATAATSDDGADLDTSLNDIESIEAHPTGSAVVQLEILVASA